MRNVITVMNAKGGVGKTTLVLAMAETLSTYHGQRILLIDSDAHASLSSMLLPKHWLETIQTEGRTFVDYLIGAVLTTEPVRWQDFVAEGVSDVDDARSINLMLGGGHLTLFEREVAKGNHLRQTVRAFLGEARAAYDLVLAWRPLEAELEAQLDSCLARDPHGGEFTVWRRAAQQKGER